MFWDDKSITPNHLHVTMSSRNAASVESMYQRGTPSVNVKITNTSTQCHLPRPRFTAKESYHVVNRMTSPSSLPMVNKGRCQSFSPISQGRYLSSNSPNSKSKPGHKDAGPFQSLEQSVRGRQETTSCSAIFPLIRYLTSQPGRQ
jgi:hypothetical protein